MIPLLHPYFELVDGKPIIRQGMPNTSDGAFAGERQVC
jgi:hypothetical protein